MTEEDIPRLLLLNKRELNREIRAELRRRHSLNGAWDKYIGLKHRIIGFPGKNIARLIKWINRPGGERFCERIRYCERKAWFKERLRLLEKLTGKRVLVANDEAEKIVRKLSDGQELLDIAKEFLQDFISEAADYVFPVSLVVKIFKYGLDELCEC